MRSDRQRLGDIIAAVSAIQDHLRRGGLTDGLVFDAVRLRLFEIGEAVKDIDPALLANEPCTPWSDIARMRDVLAHRYFDTGQAIVASTIDNDLPPLLAACQRLTEAAP